MDTEPLQTKNNPIEKWAKDMKSLTKEKLEMTKRLWKDVSLEIREMHTNFHLLIFKE